MNNLVGTRDLRLFVVVAEELHFRRAAEKLRLAQPQLSAQIRQLEERLGVKLLNRTTRSVGLTPAGAHFLSRAKYTLAQVEEAVVSTRLVADGRSGHLRVGFTPAASFEVLPWLIREFRQRHPEIFVAPFYRETSAQIPELLEGRLDCGLLRLPVHTRRLTTLSLSSEGVALAVPRDHPFAERETVTLEDLSSEDFIQYAPIAGVAFQEHVAGHCHRAGFKPRVLFEAHDTFAILTMVAAGLGIAILPDWVMRAPHPGIDFKPLTQVPPLVDLALAWVSEQPASHVRAFIELAEGYAKRVT